MHYDLQLFNNVYLLSSTAGISESLLENNETFLVKEEVSIMSMKWRAGNLLYLKWLFNFYAHNSGIVSTNIISNNIAHG